MNITLANGQVFNIKNAPEDITQDEVLMALKATDPKLYKMQLNSLAKTGADASQLAKDTGPVDAAMIAAGGATDALGTGIQELYAGLTGDDQEKARLQAAGEERKGIMAPLQAESPVATALGSALPYMAVPVGAAAGAVGKGVGLLGRGVGSQALQRGGQAVGKSLLADAAVGGTALGAADQDSTALGGAAGGVLGFGAGKVAEKGLKSLAKHTPEVSKVWNWAKGKGFDIPPGARVGGVTGDVLRGVETPLKSSAWTRAPYQAIQRKNQKAANKIATEAIGESGDSIAMSTLDKAHTRLSNEFENLASKTKKVALDQDFIDNLAAVEAKHDYPDLPLDKKFFDLVDGVRKTAYERGEMTAKEFQRRTRRMGSVARTLARSKDGDRDAAIAMMEVVSALDDAMEKSLGGPYKAAWKKAKNQYKNLMTIETGQAVKTDGDISLPQLATILRKKDPKNFRTGTTLYGRGTGDKATDDLYNAAHFGDISEFKDLVGESGTGLHRSKIFGPALKGAGAGAATGGLIGQFAGAPVPGAMIGGVTGGLLGAAAPITTGLGSAAYYGSRHIPDALGRSSGILGRAGASTGGPDEARLRGLLGQ